MPGCAEAGWAPREVDTPQGAAVVPGQWGGLWGPDAGMLLHELVWAELQQQPGDLWQRSVVTQGATVSVMFLALF